MTANMSEEGDVVIIDRN